MSALPLLAGPASVEVFGVTLIGVNERNGVKVLMTLALLGAVWAFRRLALAAVRRLPGSRSGAGRFWTRQGVQLVAAIVIALGVISVWVTPDADLGVGLGLLSAGLAFALSQVVTAFAAYFVILRGDVFSVGDRVTLGGVRGDVIKLGFLKTTVMEMGQPPAVQEADPAIWVHSRQPTGRVISVSNGAIFTEPVYNYSRDFPYLWEEIAVPLPYAADRRAAERILLDAAAGEAVRPGDVPPDVAARMQRLYGVDADELEPAVYWRITDQWLELSLRFLVPDRGVRGIKDRMSRRILAGFEEAGLEIASATYDIVGLPAIEVRRGPDDRRGAAAPPLRP